MELSSKIFLKNVRIIFVFESSGKTFDFYEWKHENYITRHILKMVAVQASKWRLATVTLVDKYKALKETDWGQSCAATANKYSVAKNTVSHWLKKRKPKYLKQLREIMSQKREKE